MSTPANTTEVADDAVASLLPLFSRNSMCFRIVLERSIIAIDTARRIRLIISSSVCTMS
jgi:hypothetical protein